MTLFILNNIEPQKYFSKYEKLFHIQFFPLSVYEEAQVENSTVEVKFTEMKDLLNLDDACFQERIYIRK